ncbi:hypothetical protein [Flavobacterium subsaxonicum]|uniref:Lipoprotein n=1 Tax=Flavobacterium subsaxonicum WB 4.1-42 = DSM 21790 TaxID=1121898 RepID=A0A0A2N323_9FLAO|nr:hypothetical protein [Flavobacterium subsaxonicum]KGO94860.1 hypothetical protein Q766_01715 [Flavobacterium subsaxonicum WB 4.1-42 = DSM 21790]
MKKTIYLLLALSIFTVSCSSDDDSAATTTPSENDYLPLTAGNYWVYDVPGSVESGRDSLYVANDTVIAGSAYSKFKTRELAFGFFTGALANNGVKKEGNKLLLTGSASVNFTEEFPINIGVTDLIIFNEDATVNDALGAVTGTIEQTYDGYPLTFTYTLTTTAKEDLPNYSVGTDVYTDVKRVETKLNLKIETELLGFTAEILKPQDIVTSYQYYAKGIGVVYVDTTLQYNINAEIAATFGIPATRTETQKEILDTYSVE